MLIALACGIAVWPQMWELNIEKLMSFFEESENWTVQDMV